MGNKITGHKDSGIFKVLNKHWQSNLTQVMSTVAAHGQSESKVVSEVSSRTYSGASIAGEAEW